MSIVTPDLCDAFPDLIQVAEPLFANFGGRDAFSGQIQTVKCFEDNSKVKEQLAQPGQGKVLVVDGGGSLRCALLGDQVAAQAAKNGWEGVLIYGCVRDVDALAETDLGIQALAAHPKKTEKRDVGDVNLPVTFAGLTFHPGHFLYADNNGVIISPKALA